MAPMKTFIRTNLRLQENFTTFELTRKAILHLKLPHLSIQSHGLSFFGSMILSAIAGSFPFREVSAMSTGGQIVFRY
jgi:hypothetical protein